jgi:hypothetical protein
MTNDALTEDSLPPELFRRIGEALYAEAGWQGRLAQALEINERTVRRMRAGTYPVPLGIAGSLYDLVRERRDELTALAGEMEAFAGPRGSAEKRNETHENERGRCCSRRC